MTQPLHKRAESFRQRTGAHKERLQIRMSDLFVDGLSRRADRRRILVRHRRHFRRQLRRRRRPADVAECLATSGGERRERAHARRDVDDELSLVAARRARHEPLAVGDELPAGVDQRQLVISRKVAAFVAATRRRSRYRCRSSGRRRRCTHRVHQRVDVARGFAESRHHHISGFGVDLSVRVCDVKTVTWRLFAEKPFGEFVTT